MKHLQILLFTAFLVLPLSFVFGQNKSTPGFDFFAKKKNSYSLTETGYYGKLNTFDNGQKLGHSNSTYADINWNYWLGSGLGAGINVYANWSGSHFTNEQLTRYWTISPNVSYGKTLTDHWGVYARAGVTFGTDKYIFKSSINNTTEKSNLFGYNATIAFPYRFSKYTALTTGLSYNHFTTKFDDGKEKDNGFGINLHLEDYLSCNEMHCDPGTGFKLSQHKYDQGHGFINYDSHGQFRFGNIRTTYTGSPTTIKSDYNNLDLDLNGSFYIIDGVSLGGGLNFGHSSQKSGPNNTNTLTYFDFDPEININVPVNNGWRNLFVKGGGYFGSQNYEVKSGTLTFTDKYRVTGFNAGAGYTAFFAEETALRACVYYRSITTKEKETGDKTKQKGIAASVGLVHSFGN